MKGIVAYNQEPAINHSYYNSQTLNHRCLKYTQWCNLSMVKKVRSISISSPRDTLAELQVPSRSLVYRKPMVYANLHLILMRVICNVLNMILRHWITGCCWCLLMAAWGWWSFGWQFIVLLKNRSNCWRFMCNIKDDECIIIDNVCNNCNNYCCKLISTNKQTNKHSIASKWQGYDCSRNSKRQNHELRLKISIIQLLWNSKDRQVFEFPQTSFDNNNNNNNKKPRFKITTSNTAMNSTANGK